MIRPNLTDPTNWALRGQIDRVAPVIGQRILPIGEIIHAPVYFSPTLLIETSCANSLSSWQSAGRINMRFPVGFGIGQDEYVDSGSWPLKLGTTIVRFPNLGQDRYATSFSVPRWFNQVTYRIYEYVGDGQPSIEGKLDRIYDQF